jgi:hypothetical protein
MGTITRSALSTRRRRAWALVVAAACTMALLSQPATASASTPTPVSVTGKVGAYRFLTDAAPGSAGSCGYANGQLSRIDVAPARAKMRAYWAKPHNGRLAVGQYVEFIAQLSALRHGTWTTLSTAHKYRLVATTLTRLPALPAFTRSRGITSGYDAYRVVESIKWLRPTDNALEGSVTTTLGHYRVARHWAGDCPAPPRAVAGVKAGRTTSKVKLVWTNRVPSRTKSIVVRYARGITPPALPGAGHAVTLPAGTPTQVVLAHLRPKTRYAFSIWAYGKSHIWSSRRTTVVTTRAPKPHPLGTPTIAAGASGQSVSWTVSVDPNGRPATVHVTTDHGFDQTYTTGTTPWTSPAASQVIGYSSTDHISVTVSATGRASTSASGSATTGSAPAPPAVSVSRGAACAGHCGLCLLLSCAYIHVTTANFAGSVTCSFSSQLGSTGFANETYGANDSKDSVNYWGLPGMWVQASCGGVTARTNW